jgi:hypothetical protein
VHHRVDTGGGGDGRRQPQRQRRVEKRDVGDDDRRRDAHLLVGAGGDDGDRRHLRAGAGGGRREQQRQTRPLGAPYPIDVGEILAADGEERRELRHVERGAAAEADDAGRPVRDGGGGGGPHHPLRRVGEDVGEHRDLHPRRRQRGERRRDQSGGDDAGVGDEKHTRPEPRRRELAEAVGGAEAKDEARRRVERERGDRVCHRGLRVAAGRQDRHADACSPRGGWRTDSVRAMRARGVSWSIVTAAFLARPAPVGRRRRRL